MTKTNPRYLYNMSLSNNSLHVEDIDSLEDEDVYQEEKLIVPLISTKP